MSTNEDRGRFAWYENMCRDVEASVAFYTAALPWTSEAWTDGPMPYTMFSGAEGPVAGVMKLQAEAEAMGAPPHWLAYTTVPDTDVSVAQAQGLGASVLAPAFDVPTVGRMAVLRDPQGGVFAVFTPEGGEVPPDAPTPLGGFSWNELATSDPEAAFDFYAALFGWVKTDAMDMGPMGTYQMYGQAGHEGSLGGIFRRPPEMPVTAWLYYVKVGDVDACVAKIQAAGGSVVSGPMEVPGGDRVASCVDPEGAAFGIHGT